MLAAPGKQHQTLGLAPSGNTLVCGERDPASQGKTWVIELAMPHRTSHAPIIGPRMTAERVMTLGGSAVANSPHLWTHIHQHWPLAGFHILVSSTGWSGNSSFAPAGQPHTTFLDHRRPEYTLQKGRRTEANSRTKAPCAVPPQRFSDVLDRDVK